MSSLQPPSNQTARAGYFKQPVCSQTQIPVLQASSGSLHTQTELCGEPKVRQEVALKMLSLLSNSFKQESGGYHLFV